MELEYRIRGNSTDEICSAQSLSTAGGPSYPAAPALLPPPDKCSLCIWCSPLYSGVLVPSLSLAVPVGCPCLATEAFSRSLTTTSDIGGLQSE